MNKSIPAYGVIAANDYRYTLEYKKEVTESCTITGRLEGYNIDVFRDAPADLPVMDWRTATGSIVDFIFSTEPPIEVYNVNLGARLTMNEYFEKAKTYGCTIRTVRECYEISADKRYQRMF